MTPDIIELFKSVCEKMRKADYVEARSDMLQALERFEHSKPQTINWIKCSDRLPEINVESIEMSGARVMSNLKKLDHSVFDGLPPEYKFAAVDANGLAWAYEQRPYVRFLDAFSFYGRCHSIPGKFDATDWQNSLIEREEIAAAQKPQPLRRGDLIEYDGDICVVYKKFGDGDGIGYRVVSLTGDAGRWYVTHGELTRIGSIRKKIKRLKAQMGEAK